MSGFAHVDSILPEVNKRISMMRRLREYFPQKSLLTLVKANIVPKILYGSEIWCNISSGHERGVLHKVELLYKEAIRAALGEWRNNRTPSEELWVSLGVSGCLWVSLGGDLLGGDLLGG